MLTRPRLSHGFQVPHVLPLLLPTPPLLLLCLQVTVLVSKAGPQLKPEQSLVLVGGSAALGLWDPAHGLPLERSGEDSPMWTAQRQLRGTLVFFILLLVLLLALVLLLVLMLILFWC